MHRFYIPPERSQGDKLRLEEREAHHAIGVLRLRRGDPVTILDGAGTVLSGEIAEASKSWMEVKVFERRSVPPLPWRITLFQAMPKGKIFEDIVEKATELGVHRIVPIASQRVVATPENPARKLERWKLAAIEAVKQCGSPWLPEIEAPASLADRVTERFDLSFFGSLQPNSQHVRHWLDTPDRLKPGQQTGKSISIGIWIGPEGDFTPEEISLLESAGARPITLGPNVLRSETAAIYSLAILNHELQWRLQAPSGR